MQNVGPFVSHFGLENHGIRNANIVYWNYSTPALYEEAIRRREVVLSHRGPLVARTGQHTGRAPDDKFVVKEPSSSDKIWWGDVNRPFSEEGFQVLHRRMCAYLQGRELYVQDCFAGADPIYRIPIRVVTETAWHNLFARNMFRQADPASLHQHEPEFTVIHCPYFHAVPSMDRTNSEAFILVDFGSKLVLIGGTSYAGEIKKSVFTIMNYLLPQEKVLSMHCSANVGSQNDVALFFGLSGTGKTTLSSDPERTLIGDDEHGWSDHGVFNFEGGCYAKVIRLSAEAEPDIFETTRTFGTILENVMVDADTRHLDLEDAILTENTRAAYPIASIPHASQDGMGGHPNNILMLTADAFGVLPPISRLSPEQAMYHFLSGYTAKLGGTEKGLGSEPVAVFSTCFGAPFMALHPSVYSNLLGRKISEHKVNCWLVNTGWSGGPPGIGRRFKIAYTRAMVRAALTGAFSDIPSTKDPVFGLHIPDSCPDVPSEVLKPRKTWDNKGAYDSASRELAARFSENFGQYREYVDEPVRSVGPATT